MINDPKVWAAAFITLAAGIGAVLNAPNAGLALTLTLLVGLAGGLLIYLANKVKKNEDCREEVGKLKTALAFVYALLESKNPQLRLPPLNQWIGDDAEEKLTHARGYIQREQDEAKKRHPRRRRRADTGNVVNMPLRGPAVDLGDE